MNTGKTLEDLYLEELIQNKQCIFVYLSSSIRLKGYLVNHTPEALFLRSIDGITQKVHKRHTSAVCVDTVFNTHF
jgi:hypothetical protein